MIIFPFPRFKQHARFLKSLPGYKLGNFQTTRFPNQEIYARIDTTDSVPQVYSLRSEELKILSTRSILSSYARHMRRTQEKADKAIKKLEQ